MSQCAVAGAGEEILQPENLSKNSQEQEEKDGDVERMLVEPRGEKVQGPVPEPCLVDIADSEEEEEVVKSSVEQKISDLVTAFREASPEEGERILKSLRIVRVVGRTESEEEDRDAGLYCDSEGEEGCEAGVESGGLALQDNVCDE